MLNVNYETYNIEDKRLLKMIKENIDVFRMLGFTTFEQGKNYKIGTLSTEGKLQTNFIRNNNEKKIILTLKNNEREVTVTYNFKTFTKKVNFRIVKNQEKVIISYSYELGTPILEFTIIKERLLEPKKIMVQIEKKGIYIYRKDKNKEEYLRCANYLAISQLPYVIASYYECFNEKQIYERLVDVTYSQNFNRFYLGCYRYDEGKLVFSNRSTLLKYKDAQNYALELLETKVIQNFLFQIFKDLEQSLIGFPIYIKKLPINRLFQQEIILKQFPIYCVTQKENHEKNNPIRIEQLLEETAFEIPKTKILKK